MFGGNFDDVSAESPKKHFEDTIPQQKLQTSWNDFAESKKYGLFFVDPNMELPLRNASYLGPTFPHHPELQNGIRL